MIAIFSDDFGDSLKKHAALKKIVQKKVDMILQNPIGLSEPLKGNFRGYYSVPVKKNFLVIYLYCLICRRRGDQLRPEKQGDFVKNGNQNPNDHSCKRER